MTFIGMGKISVVDDDDSIRRATKSLLRSVGYDVETFASAELFLESKGLRETACLVLDVRMSGMNGLELQHRLNEATSQVPIIFVTAHDEGFQRETAMEAGATHFFRKPFDADVFLSAIRAVVRSGRTFESPSSPEDAGIHVAPTSLPADDRASFASNSGCTEDKGVIGHE